MVGVETPITPNALWQSLLYNWAGAFRPGAIFSFLYLKKIKISKIYVSFEKFQNYPRSPYGRRQALDVIFFFKFATRSLVEKNERGACHPPNGRQGGLSPPLGPPGLPPLYKHSTSIPSSFEPKNSTKNPEKKRGVRRREAAKSCRIPHLWSAG